MRIDAPPKPDPALIDEAAAALRLWLVGAIAWLVEQAAQQAWLARCAPALGVSLRAAAREIRVLLFLRAYRRLYFPGRPLPKRVRPHDPAFVVSRGSSLRRVTRAAFRGLHRGGLMQRAHKLRYILDHPEAWIVRILRRILRGFRAVRLALGAPPAEPLPARLAPIVAGADTS